MAGAITNAKLKFFHEDTAEKDIGTIFSISGPVVVAEKMAGVVMHEIVRVGPNHLVGEVIQIKGETAAIQVYEETAGLQAGDPVIRTHKPLSVELGPGIMNNVYDGIQRPLVTENLPNDPIFLPKGVDTPPLNKDTKWHFEPQLKISDHITGGDIFGKVVETPLITHHIMLPPGEMGTITWIASADNYTVTEPVLELEFHNKKKSFSMLQYWPVRVPRPVSQTLSADIPLLCGVRFLDALFPCVQGGTCAIPGAWGSGKTAIIHPISKYSNSDCVFMVGCGERGNEVAEVLLEFPEVQTSDRQHSIMERTTLVANTSNMPVAAREASIYTGITLSEYYRDMGYNVTMMADSTSRWAEALREISSRLGEMPGESGHPAYLGARLSSFYERAGKVVCLGSPTRKGSITIMGTVSPPGGDFSEPVTANTLNIVQVFWALDRKLAQKKHFPNINWMYSFSQHVKTIYPYYEDYDSEFVQYRDTIMKILHKEEELQEQVQLVGRDDIAEIDQVTLFVAKMIREDFLSQNMFTPYDRFCPLYKTIWMMKIFCLFYNLTLKTVAKGKSWKEIKQKLSDLVYRIDCVKFEDPGLGEQILVSKLKRLCDEIQDNFYLLSD